MMTDAWEFAVSVLEDADSDLERACQRVDTMLKNPQCRKQQREVWDALIMYTLERFWRQLVNPVGAMEDIATEFREWTEAWLPARPITSAATRRPPAVEQAPRWRGS